MRAVLVSPHPGTNAGGVERFCDLLGTALRRAGWETTEVGPTVTVAPGWARLGLEPVAQATSAAIRARRARPDLVISNGYLGGPTGTRRIHVFHGTMVRHVAAGGEGRLRYRLRQGFAGGVAEALSARGATSVAVSQSTRGELWRYYRERVDAVIPNGVDTERFHPGDREEARRALGLDLRGRYALFVGRPEYRKGFDLVPEACATAGYRLIVAGPSAPSGAVALGVLGPDRVADAYRAADCVVFPTRYEACSFVVLEALASGVPLITTSVGWMADFARRRPGYGPLIVSPDVADVARVLRALPDLDVSPAVDDARELVARENGLAAFGSRWTEFASKVMGT